jgi:hypothetical protein
METLQWAIGILVVILMGVMGFFATQLWGHVVECRQLMARLEGINKDVERMKEDIGTHSTGIRGHLHETANLCMQHELRIALLERQ